MRELPGFGGRFLVTEDGKIWSTLKGGFLVPRIRNGYVNYSTSVDGKFTTILAHRAVAFAYLPKEENKTCVNHKDGDKMNNHHSNLEWCTFRENTQHAYSSGLLKDGENHASSKLSDEIVKQIREEYIPRHPTRSGAALGRKYGVTQSLISLIVTNKHREHGKP